MTHTQSKRRSFIKAAGASGIVALSGCLGGDDPKDDTVDNSGETDNGKVGETDDGLADTLRFYGWGGGWNDAWVNNVFEPFEEEYGVGFEPTGFASEDEMIANVKTSPGEYDLVTPVEGGLYRGIKQDLWRPLDIDQIDTWENLLPVFQDWKPDVGEEHHIVPTHYGTVAMAYNSDHINEEPTTWAELWNDKYEGDIILSSTVDTRVDIAAFHLGYNPTDLPEMSDAEYEDVIDEIFDAIAQQHSLVNSYWTSGQEQVNMYANEEGIIGDAWGGRIDFAQSEGYDNLHYVFPEEGVPGWGAGLCLSQGSDKVDAAHKFMEFVLRPEIHAKLTADGEPSLGYPPSTDVVTEGVKQLYDYDPTGGEGLTFSDPAFIEEKREEWVNTFDRIKLGQY